MLTLAQNQNNAVNQVSGWRMLSKTSLPDGDVRLLLDTMRNLNNILEADKEDFEKIVGPEKAIVMTKEIQRIKNQ